MPRPPAMQWPNLTLVEMNNIVEMDSRIISQCFQFLWAFFFFFKEMLGGFLARQMAATACRIPEPSKLFLDSAILIFFFNIWFFFFSNGMSFLVPPLDKEYDFSVASAFNSSLSWKWCLKHSSLTGRQFSFWFLWPGEEEQKISGS